MFKMPPPTREFADLQWRPVLLPTIGVYILFGLPVAAGCPLCVQPGIVVP
jgi:hypothetical protein